MDNNETGPIKVRQVDENDNTIAIAVIWDKDAILQIAKEKNLILTNVEISDILESLRHHHDAEYGIDWEHVRCEIEELKGFTRNGVLYNG